MRKVLLTLALLCAPAFCATVLPDITATPATFPNGLNVNGAYGNNNFLQVGTATTNDTLANTILSTTATTNKALVLQGSASQAADLLQVQSSNGTVYSAIPYISGTLTGAQNTLFGSGGNGSALTSGFNNCFYGFDTGAGTIGGAYNTYIGTAAGNNGITAKGCTAIGDAANITNGMIGGVSIGIGSTATANGQFVAGSTFSFNGTNGNITNVFFGNGVTAATPVAYTINGSGGSGTNVNGANLLLAGGIGTGTGTGGSLLLQVAPFGLSGSSANTLATVATFADGSSGTTITTTTPVAAAASTAGNPVAITATNATAGTSSNGAAAGGAITITSGNAARLVSGNSNGGDITFNFGTGLGTGRTGQAFLNGTTNVGNFQVSQGAQLSNTASTATFSITNVQVTGNNTVTITTSTAHGFNVNEWVATTAVTDVAVNGTYQCTVVTSTTYTYIVPPGGLTNQNAADTGTSIGQQLLIPASTIEFSSTDGPATPLKLFNPSTQTTLFSVDNAGNISGIGTNLTALNAANITTNALAVANGGTNNTAFTLGPPLYYASSGTAILSGTGGQTNAGTSYVPVAGDNRGAVCYRTSNSSFTMGTPANMGIGYTVTLINDASNQTLTVNTGTNGVNGVSAASLSFVANIKGASITLWSTGVNGSGAGQGWRTINSNNFPGIQNTGLIYSDNAARGNGADTTEDTMNTYSLPANAYNSTISVIHMTGGGTFSNTTNSQTVRVYFGSQVLGTIVATVSLSGQYGWMADIYRTGSSTQKATFTSWTDLTATTSTTVTTGTTPAQTDTAAITIKTTAQEGTSGTLNAITANGFSVYEY